MVTIFANPRVNRRAKQRDKEADLNTIPKRSWGGFVSRVAITRQDSLEQRRWSSVCVGVACIRRSFHRCWELQVIEVGGHFLMTAAYWLDGTKDSIGSALTPKHSETGSYLSIFMSNTYTGQSSVRRSGGGRGGGVGVEMQMSCLSGPKIRVQFSRSPREDIRFPRHLRIYIYYNRT